MSDGNPLVELLEGTVAEAGEASFLTDIRLDASLSYRELETIARSLAAELAERDVGHGDRVAYLTSNNAFFYPLLFACAARGAVLVPLGAELHAAELRAMVENARPVLVYHDEQTPERTLEACGAAARIPVASSWIVTASGGSHAAAPGPAVTPCAPGDEALIIYTSGTTQGSKGIVLTHGNLDAMSRSFVNTYPYSGGRRFLCVLPFHHINAPMVTGLSCIRDGAHVLLAELYGFKIARSFWETVAERGVNVLSLTPSIMASLLDLHPGGTREDLAGVEYALVGTAPLGERLWREFEERFGFPCYQGYGLTETTAWATMTPPDERKRYDTVGLPVDCEIAILKPEGDQESGGGKEAGEVKIRGDCVMKGYSDPGVAPGALRDGWFHSGDLGYVDEDGQLVIVGRIKNIIKRKGNVVFPEEIDAVLAEHDAVRESATVGVGDPMLGEEIVSACVPRSTDPGLRRALRRHLADRMSAHKIPDRIELVEELPRNPVGKIRINELRKLLGG